MDRTHYNNSVSELAIKRRGHEQQHSVPAGVDRWSVLSSSSSSVVAVRAGVRSAAGGQLLSVDGAVRVVVELQVGRDGGRQLRRASSQRRDAVPAPHLLLAAFVATACGKTFYYGSEVFTAKNYVNTCPPDVQ